MRFRSTVAVRSGVGLTALVWVLGAAVPVRGQLVNLTALTQQFGFSSYEAGPATLNGFGQVAFNVEIRDSPRGERTAVFYGGHGDLRLIRAEGVEGTSVAFGLNDGGTVVGALTTAEGERAFRFTAVDGLNWLFADTAVPSVALRIDNAGRILGVDTNGFGQPVRYWLLEGGVRTDLDDWFAGDCVGLDLSPGGLLLVRRENSHLIYDLNTSTITPLPDLDRVGVGAVVNDGGDVGGLDFDGAPLAFVGGRLQVARQGVGSTHTIETISDGGVLGGSVFSDEAGLYGIVVENGIRRYLDDILEKDYRRPDLTGSYVVHDFNARGQMVGTVRDGQVYLFTPVPEPGAFGVASLVMVGAVIVSSRRRRGVAPGRG